MIIPPDQLSITDYHNSAPSFFSKTSLRLFKEKGAPWFKLWLDKKVEAPVPGGVEQGLAIDCVLTEDSADFDRRFAVKPKGLDGRTKEGKAWLEIHKDMSILSEDDMLILADAVAAVRDCCAWPDIEKALAQLTIRRESKGLGFGLQARPDWLNLERGHLLDLKKTRDLDQFGKQAINLGYHTQAAVAGWCLAGEGISLELAQLIAVEWERGARCMVYDIPTEALASADQDMRDIAAEIAERINTGNWTHRQLKSEPLPIPEYLLRRMSA